MILVILGLCIIGIIAGIVIYEKASPGSWGESSDGETFGAFIGIVSGMLGVVALIAAIVVGVKVSNTSVIDEKIAMYEEENAAIEEQVATVVEQYQKYETDIFTDLKPESVITLVSLYPELKADSLVQKQIDVYIANNDKIKDLKEKDINGSVWRWWLYFGR